MLKRDRAEREAHLIRGPDRELHGNTDALQLINA